MQSLHSLKSIKRINPAYFTEYHISLLNSNFLILYSLSIKKRLQSFANICMYILYRWNNTITNRVWAQFGMTNRLCGNEAYEGCEYEEKTILWEKYQTDYLFWDMTRMLNYENGLTTILAESSRKTYPYVCSNFFWTFLWVFVFMNASDFNILVFRASERSW